MTHARAGEAEYAALMSGADQAHTPCIGDDRFVSDDLTEPDKVQMRGTCRRCPLIALCGAYATAAKVTGGFWAGKHYGAARRIEQTVNESERIASIRRGQALPDATPAGAVT